MQCTGSTLVVKLPYGVMGKVKTMEKGKGTSNYHEREGEVDEIYRELDAKHSGKYEVPKLRLWARMISSNLHDSMDYPPKIPVFGGGLQPKRPRQDLSSALNGAAVAFTQALNHGQGTGSEEQPTSITTTQMQVDLRMKNLEQLKFIKQLYDNGVLTETEFTEQKENILSAIRNLLAR